MRQRFFTSTAQTRLIKNILNNTPIPIYDTVQPGDYIIKGCKYIYNISLIICTKSGLLEGDGEFLTLDYSFYWGAPKLNHTETLKDATGFYDSKVHEWLGRYLRAYRDMMGVNLMPFYNCFSGVYTSRFKLVPVSYINTYTDENQGTTTVKANKISVYESEQSYDTYSQGTDEFNSKYVEQSSYKVLQIPVKLNRTYTIAIDCDSTVRIAPAFINHGHLVKVKIGTSEIPLTDIIIDNVTEEGIISPISIEKTNTVFTKPFTIFINNKNQNIINTTITEDNIGITYEQLLQRYEKYLYLLIQLPKDNTSSVVVLEGDYTNLDTNKIFSLETVEIHNDNIPNDPTVSEVFVKYSAVNEFTNISNAPYVAYLDVEGLEFDEDYLKSLILSIEPDNHYGYQEYNFANKYYYNDFYSLLDVYTSFKAKIVAKQDIYEEDRNDYPSPTNVKPISGWTGMNIMSTGPNIWGGLRMADDIVNAINNSSYSFKGSDSDGSYVAITSEGDEDEDNIELFRFPFKDETQYTFIFKVKKSTRHTFFNLRIYYTNGTYTDIAFSDNPNIGEVYTVAIKSEPRKTIDSIKTYVFGGITYIYYDDSGLFEGNLTIDDFTSYKEAITSISWDNQIGTIYGGELDVPRGNLKITHNYVDMSTLPWIYNSSAKYFYAIIEDKINGFSGDFITDCYKIVNSHSSVILLQNNEILQGTGTYPSNKTIYLKDNRYNNVDNLKSALSEHYMVYKLQEPINYQINPVKINILPGENRIWCNTSDDYIRISNFNSDIREYISNSSPGKFTFNLPDDRSIILTQPGDVTLDGLINNADILSLHRYLNNQISYNSQQIFNADINNDGIINDEDLGILQSIVNGLNPIPTAILIRVKKGISNLQIFSYIPIPEGTRFNVTWVNPIYDDNGSYIYPVKNVLTNNKLLDELLLSKLSLLQFNDEKNYPFADTLIEYLTLNVIDSAETISDNIKRTQDYFGGLNRIDSTYGAWSNYLRAKIYLDTIYNNRITHLDNIGYVDKIVESTMIEQKSEDNLPISTSYEYENYVALKQQELRKNSHKQSTITQPQIMSKNNVVKNSLLINPSSLTPVQKLVEDNLPYKKPRDEEGMVPPGVNDD